MVIIYLQIPYVWDCFTFVQKVMDPAPRGLGIPVVTLLLEVKQIHMKQQVLTFLVPFVLVFEDNLLSRVGLMPSLR